MVPPRLLIWIWLAEFRAFLLPQAVPVLLAFALGMAFEHFVMAWVVRQLRKAGVLASL